MTFLFILNIYIKIIKVNFLFVLIEFMISKLDMVEISSNIYFKINFKCSAQKLELKWTLIQDGCQYYEKKFQIANKKKNSWNLEVKLSNYRLLRTSSFCIKNYCKWDSNMHHGSWNKEKPRNIQMMCYVHFINKVLQSLWRLLCQDLLKTQDYTSFISHQGGGIHLWTVALFSSLL